MKKSLFIVGLLLICSFVGVASASDYYIGTPQELIDFATLVNEGSITANGYLTADIDMSGQSWSPIGSGADRPYGGIFDGQGHVISNLTINLPSTSPLGMFGYVVNATISRIGCIGFDITGSYNVGGLVGYAESASISNCYSTDCTVSGSGGVGGLVGYAESASISNCYSTNCTVSGSNYFVGGLVGCANSASISNCAVYGGTHGNVLIGTGSATVTNCYTSDDVTSETFHTRGFWDGTGVSGTTYLSWDFTTPIWYWDFDNELPTLQAIILHISNLVPLSGSLEFGTPFTCTVTASSSNPITYQWYQSTNGVSFTPMSGQTTNVMTYTAPAKGDYYFKVIVADGVDMIDSLTDFGAVTLEVYGMKIWSIVPLSSTLKVGENFNVTANVTSPYTISYQWYESGDNSTYAPMTDQTSANLNFTAMVKGNHYYKLIVNDGVDTIDSLSKFSPVTLVVWGISNNTLTMMEDFTEWKNNYTQYLTSNLILGNDIDMSGFTDGIPQFNGGFNGQSYALTALTVPLIQSLGGNIYNLTVKDSLINMGGNVGLIASSVTQGSTLTNVFGENSFVKSTNSNAGSLVGAITGTDVSIQNCGATSCTVVGSTSAGGIAGATQSDTDIVNAQVSRCDVLATNGKAYGVAP